MPHLLLCLIALLACATQPDVGDAATPFDACMEYMEAACYCGLDDCEEGIYAESACRYLKEDQCEIVNAPNACAQQEVAWALLDEWNCYNEALAETCEAFTDECEP